MKFSCLKKSVFQWILEYFPVFPTLVKFRSISRDGKYREIPPVNTAPGNTMPTLVFPGLTVFLSPADLGRLLYTLTKARMVFSADPRRPWVSTSEGDGGFENAMESLVASWDTPLNTSPVKYKTLGSYTGQFRLQFISYKFIKGFLAITFLLLVISS